MQSAHHSELQERREGAVSDQDRAFELISPFPESDLPAVWMWAQPYLYKTEFYDLAEAEFVAIKRAKQDRVMSWGISRDGELGGYIEFEAEGERVGFMSVLCKVPFFRYSQRTVVIPALGEAIGEVFEQGASLILFDPLESNRQMVNLLRKLGARDAASERANGVPEKRVLAIGSGDWTVRQ